MNGAVATEKVSFKRRSALHQSVDLSDDSEEELEEFKFKGSRKLIAADSNSNSWEEQNQKQFHREDTFAVEDENDEELKECHPLISANELSSNTVSQPESANSLQA